MGTAPSFDLHRLALAVAAELRRDRRVQAVALTGSLARGDWQAGSDVDLWVLGNRSDRECFLRGDTPVTLLWQTPRQACLMESLTLYEVEDIWVLYDPAGHFRRVRAACARHAAGIRDFIVSGTARLIRELEASAAHASPAPAIATLRELARRAACLRIYLDWGWRVPRVRAFERHLASGVWRLFAQVQGLPPRAGDWSRLLNHLEAHPQELRSWYAPRQHFPPELPTPDHLAWLAGHGRHADAWILVRQALLDVPRRHRQSPAVRAAWEIVQGFHRQPPTEADARRCARLVARLLARLELDEWVDLRRFVVAKPVRCA
jgi:predicted nucleotidyltransferase